MTTDTETDQSTWRMTFANEACIYRDVHANILTCSVDGGWSEKERGNSRRKQKGQPHHWGIPIVYCSLIFRNFTVSMWSFTGIFTKCQKLDKHKAAWAEEPLISYWLMSAAHHSFVSPGSALTQWGTGARGQMPCCPALSNVSMLSDSSCIYIHITTGTLQGGRWHSTLWDCRDW